MWLPMQYLHIDLLQTEVSSRGYGYILVAVDQLTGFVFLKPLASKESKEIVARLLETVTLFGFPAHLKSDNGLEFCNQLVKELLTRGRVQHHLTIAYDHHANGVAERAVRAVRETLEKLIRSFEAEEKVREKWEELLPLIQFAINTRVNRVTQATPFSLMFGRSAFQAEAAGKINLEESQLALQNFWRLYHENVPQAVLKLRIEEQKRYPLPTGTLHDGDTVMHSVSRQRKSDDRFTGKFAVEGTTVEGHYLLKSPKGERYTAPRNFLKKVSAHLPESNHQQELADQANENRVLEDKISLSEDIPADSKKRERRRVNYALLAPDEVGENDEADKSFMGSPARKNKAQRGRLRRKG